MKPAASQGKISVAQSGGSCHKERASLVAILLTNHSEYSTRRARIVVVKKQEFDKVLGRLIETQPKKRAEK